MQPTAQRITPCLWFDTQAEEAAKFYASVFESSKIGKISRYGKEGFEIHGKTAGTVMTVEFEIEG
jgi:predicted 3-demethylubiquinone-9 3-methyltransferase (glyoxalase superfamily)